jgi:hypothetical protein
MRLTGCYKTSVSNYHPMLCNILEDQRLQYLKCIEKFGGEMFGKSVRWKGRTDSGSCG